MKMVKNTGCKLQVTGYRVQGAECKLQGASCRLQGTGCRVRGKLILSYIPLSFTTYHLPLTPYPLPLITHHFHPTPNPMIPAININHLNFSYKGNDQKGIIQFNLQVQQGDRFGIFGPNGAGKTTLMNLMTGLLTYTKGSVQLMGQEVKNNKKTINTLFGFVPQDFSFYHELSPAENMEFFGAWAGLNKRQIRQRINDLLNIMQLQDVRNKPVNKFSGGMKRRVNLAIAVMHEPPILFLDEPTVGVDVQTRHAIIDYLKALNAKGTTLIYTSHQLKEAEDLCNKIALIDEGRIIASNTLNELLKEHQQDGLEGLFLNLTGREYRD
mgnify:CR=1 FL=1